MSIIRILDIETIPDPSVWTPQDKWFLTADVPGYNSGVPKPGFRGVDPSFLVPGVGDVTPAFMPAQMKREESFPPPHAHEIIAMAWLDLDISMSNPAVPRFGMTDGVSYVAHEKNMLVDFSAQMRDAAIIVGWNTRGFDLPVLSQRAFKYGLDWSWYYNEDTRYRYRYSESGPHIDLMDWLSDFGAAPKSKMGDFARLVGLPGKNLMSGANVAEQYNAGLRGKSNIQKYCFSDVVQTAVVFLRSRLHKGTINIEEYNAALASIDKSKVVRSFFSEEELNLNPCYLNEDE